MTSTDLVSAKTLVGHHTKTKFKANVDIKVLKDRITASMLLHALGDTIGYRNARWEFNLPPEGITGENLEEYRKTQYDPNKTRDRIYEFLELGGVNNIDLTGWKVSDDTILNYATGLSLVGYHKITDKRVKGDKIQYTYDSDLFCDVISESYVLFLNELVVRDIGETTLKVLKQYKAGETWRDNHPVRLNEIAGAGNGAAIRTIPIGLAYWSEKQRDILIYTALEASRVTHNHPVGYLGGICAALFTAFAIEGRPVNTWPSEMHYLLKGSGEKSLLYKYLAKTDGLKEYERDSGLWWNAWEEWDAKFTRAEQYENRIGSDPVTRIKWFRDHLGFRSGNIGFVGRGGHDSVIIAFDSLIRTIQSGCGWEKLLYLSALHSGDSDSTACIASAWYGAMFGIGGVPANMLKHLEYREKLETVSNDLFKISANKNY
jgi:ADP-ribosylarginine hydrolase